MILVNNPLIPSSSSPKISINIFLDIKSKIINIIYEPIPVILFKNEFCLRIQSTNKLNISSVVTINYQIKSQTYIKI